MLAPGVSNIFGLIFNIINNHFKAMMGITQSNYLSIKEFRYIQVIHLKCFI